MYQSLVSASLCQDGIKYKIPSFKFCSSTDTKSVSHTDTHSEKIVNLCSGRSKTGKSIKNRKSKIFTIPMLSSYIEESKIASEFIITGPLLNY